MASKNITVKVPKALSDPKYRGKHVVMEDGRVVAAGDWKKIHKKVLEIHKKGKIPELAYVPKLDTLILVVK